MPTWIAVFLAVLALATRAQILGDALADSDEGFYLLTGERMLHGALLYVDIWDRKPAGLFLLYAGLRRLGGDGVLAYQLAGTLAAFLTALLITRTARRFAGTFGAVAAGVAYLLWLPLGSAAGGQAELFCNLPVTAAAVITLRGLEQPAPSRVLPGGVLAMLLVGIAMQIKYTALFAGVFLGCCWLWVAWRSRGAMAAVLSAAAWVLAALIPTLLIAAWYAAHGHLDAFVYANFVSALRRSPSALPERARDLGILLLVLAPLLACVRPRLKPGATGAMAHRFTLGWLAAATAGMVAFGTYFLQFLLPVLMPASLAAAPTLDRISRRSAALLLGGALLLGQAGLWIAHDVHGSSWQARRIVASVDRTRCLYVYSGLAALYRLADTCIATRYAFPSHLSRQRESGAIGTDPIQEVERIFEHAPGTVIVRSPYEGENWRARSAVIRHLRLGYHLVLRQQLGQRTVSVYRLGGPVRDRGRTLNGLKPAADSRMRSSAT